MAGATFLDSSRARDLFDAGKSCNAIAKELGVSPSTVSRWAKREGLSFDRAATAAAVSAHRIDRAAVRADIIDRLYARGIKVLERLEADEYTYRIVTADSSYTVSDDAPPAIDEKNLASAVGIYLDKATRLEQVDGNGAADGVKSMLQGLGKLLGLNDD